MAPGDADAPAATDRQRTAATIAPRRRCFLDPDEAAEAFSADCIAAATPGTPRVWIVGDSHSDSFHVGLADLSEGGRRFALSQRSASACPPVIGFAIAKRPHCRAINDDTLRRIALAPPEVVILAANWSLYDGGGWERLDPAALSRTVSLLRAAGVGRVVVLGQMPRWDVSQPTALLTQWRETGQLPRHNDRFLHATSWPADRLVGAAARAAGAAFVSPMGHLCDATGCTLTMTIAGTTYPVAWDDAHVTGRVAAVLARQWRGDLFGDVVPASPTDRTAQQATN